MVLGACDTSHHRTIIDHTAPTPQTFSEPGLAFSYPAGWYCGGETCPPALPAGSRRDRAGDGTGKERVADGADGAVARLSATVFK